ncbi:hypothetical protein OOK13_29415 [Streptomyces sp. NBC_00378]|uniref:hypothetical protein n=1 Tax=unclassified Streptomyces TaxID=2593676 RepID=UPI00225AC914|nr:MULTISPECIES: hypothetical protein [unclassified Streptomyces]MCX5112523.1 hypothetical protein [Streptomyces sp. NBC_00378]
MTPFRFPGDLIDLRRRQIRVYNQLALRPAVGAAELRRELIRLSCLISAHPYWAGRGWSMAGRDVLVRAGRSTGGGRALERRGVRRHRAPGTAMSGREARQQRRRVYR